MAILGAGIFGQAIAHLLVRAGKCDIKQWDKDPTKNKNEKNIEDVLKSARVIFLCVPTFALPEVLQNMQKFAPDNSIAVIISKGIIINEAGEARFGAELAVDMLGTERSASLGGPMLAQEILDNLPTSATIGCTGDTFAKLEPILMSDIFTVRHTCDPVGVSIVGVLKNVYAIGLGMASALELGANFVGTFTEYAQEEMQEVLRKLNFSHKIARSAAGIGDLVATGISAKSSNYTFGIELVNKGDSDMYCEGNASLDALRRRLGGFDDFNLLQAISRIITEQAPVKETLTRVFLSPHL